MKPHGSKSVTFSDTSTLFLVANLAASPARPRLWFTRSELDSFDANTKAQVRVVRCLIESRRTPGASDILGLEKFLTRELTQEYMTRRCKRTHAVLNEARLQCLARAEALRGAPRSLGSRACGRIAREPSGRGTGSSPPSPCPRPPAPSPLL